MATKKVVLKKWVRFTLLIMIAVLFGISFSMIKKSFKKIEIPIIYSYNLKQDVDYKAYLYENSYYEEEYLGKNDTYTAKLIKNIKFDFMYNYAGSKSDTVKYSYNIKGTINGKYQLPDTGNTTLWNKEYILVDKKEGESNIGLNIKETLDIDYQNYNEVVSNFRKELRIPITASFDIVMTINVYGVGDLEGKLMDTRTIIASIPLNQDVFKINTQYDKKYNNNITSDIGTVEKIDKQMLISGVSISVIGATLFIFSFDKIFLLKKKTRYNIKLNKILKDYGDIIVEVMSPTDTEVYNIIEVKNFNEMIDLEEELRIPIIFYEKEENYEGEFVIVFNNTLYKYTLNNSE